MAGNLVNIALDKEKLVLRPPFQSVGPKMTGIVLKGKAVGPSSHNHRDIVDLHAAFHLPEVCRQIYSETVSLGYATSIFTFDVEYWRHVLQPMKHWAKGLIPFHRNAVTALNISVVTFEVSGKHKLPKLKDAFPGLKQVHISLETLLLADMLDYVKKIGGWNAWKRLMQERVKNLEDLDITVNFTSRGRSMGDITKKWLF